MFVFTPLCIGFLLNLGMIVGLLLTAPMVLNSGLFLRLENVTAKLSPHSGGTTVVTHFRGCFLYQIWGRQLDPKRDSAPDQRQHEHLSYHGSVSGEAMLFWCIASVER